MDVETPDEIEERKRKEAEAAAKLAGETPVATTEKTVYQDGSQTHTTTQEVPAPSFGDRLGSALQQAGTNFVNNVQAAPENFMRNVQAAPGNFMRNVDQNTLNIAKQMAPQPAAQPDQAAYTRQQESGGKYDIGYHFKPDAQGQRASSAFGPYGLTTAAVQDIAKQDPNLNKPITEWTKEDHDKGYGILVGQNQKRLGQLGVEPSTGALQLSHLLGADGAARFLKTGEVSEAAAAANGGVERLKQIAQGRFAGGQAPASGAAPQAQSQAQPQAQPAGFQGQTNEFGGMGLEFPSNQAAAPAVNYGLGTGAGNQGIRAPGQAPGQAAPAQPNLTQAIAAFQTYQDDPNGLMKIATSDAVPDYLRERAREQFATIYDQKKKQAEAEKLMPTLNPREVGDAIQGRNKSGVGDWLQYLFLKHVGLNDLANMKGEEMGIGHAWQNATITDDKGVERGVEVLTSASGRVLKGTYAGTDTPIPKAQLEQAASGILGKGVHITKVENRINPLTSEVVSVQTLSNGQEKFKLGGKSYAGDKGVLIPEAQHTKQEDTRVNSGYKNLAAQTDNPTMQQKYQALKMAGVSDRRMEQELGFAPGSLTGNAPAGGAAPAATQAAPAATAAAQTKTPGTTVLPSGRPFDPDRPPEPLPGQSKTAHSSDVKAWETRKKSFDKDVEAYGSVESSAKQTIADIDKLMKHEGLPRIVGLTGAFPSIPGSDAANAQTDLDKIKGGTFLTALRSMKGSGSVSNVEGDKAQAAIANLAQKQDEAQFKKNLTEYKNTIMRSANVAAAAIGEPVPYPGVAPAGDVSDVRKKADDIIKKK